MKKNLKRSLLLFIVIALFAAITLTASAKTKADKYNGGGKGSTTKTAEPSGQYVIGETPSGKQVKVPVERVKEFKSNGGKIVG